MSSAAEREIRDAVVARLHAELPSARIIHELVCGGNRADLAAVTKDRIVLFEIKSERDVLDRCEQQMRTFTDCGHAAVLVAHEKWFDRAPYTTRHPRMAWPKPLYGGHGVWIYPEAAAAPHGYAYRWNLPRPNLRQPRAWSLLGLLWRDELASEASRHRISYSRRSTQPFLMEQMAWLMTGREIAEAVCRQLRARSFPEADPAVLPDLSIGVPVRAAALTHTEQDHDG